MHPKPATLRLLGVLCGCVALTAAIAAQATEPRRAFTSADYARAERLMPYDVAPLVLHSGVRPTFLPDGRFWYRTLTESGPAFVLIDSATGARSR